MFDRLPAELDGRKNTDRAGGTAFKSLVVQWLTALVSAHDFDQVVFGDGVARLTAGDVVEAREGAPFVVQTYEISFRVLDPPTRKGVDMNIRFVPGWNRDRSAVPFQETFIKTVYTLHDWYLEMQARIADRIADRLPKLRDDHLFGLIHRIKRARENE